jgi:hypothetical protein
MLPTGGTVVLRCDLDNLAAGEKQAPQPLQPGGATIGVAWCSRRLEDSAEITWMWPVTPHQRLMGALEAKNAYQCAD